MEMQKRVIARVAVLGAGVMGAQIAAHCANAGLHTVLFDLAAQEGDAHGLVLKAIDQLLKLEPAPFTEPLNRARIVPADYDHDLSFLQSSDLVIEAIAERLDWKEALYAKVAPFINDQAIFASNTSGLSIGTLANILPLALRPRFCGVHFFNPPRYMALLELIPSAQTHPSVLDALETWGTTRLGKRVIRAKDTPNFIANRVGIFSVLTVMHHADRLGLGFDLVDALTGPKIGRAKSATYRTADVVGLDTLAHVVHTMAVGLTPETDPWHAFFKTPDWLKTLIQKGALGQKTRCGVFQKVGRDIHVYRPKTDQYAPQTAVLSKDLEAILGEPDWARRLEALRQSQSVEAQFLWAIFRDLFHYCSYHLASIAESAREIDCALRWGFAWRMGPFEIWQAAGWKTIREAIAADIVAGRAMASVPLPDWVFAVEGVHGSEGSYAPLRQGLAPRSALPVYARQLLPERLLGESPAPEGVTLFENGGPSDGVRLWCLPEFDPEVGIVSFKSKMHSVSHAVLEGLIDVLRRAPHELKALVVWNAAPFSVGANLKEMLAGQEKAAWDDLDQMIRHFQQASNLLRDAEIPTVAAVSGMAYGGGLEFVLHAQHRVFALETQVGLVETAVGVIPAGGGCRLLVVEADRWARFSPSQDPAPFIEAAFEKLAHVTVSRNAQHAIGLGFGEKSDDIVFHPDELLYVAIRRARALAEVGAGPARRPVQIRVAGRPLLAKLEAGLLQAKLADKISAHDVRVLTALARVLCGGEIEAGTLVDEQWLLDLERVEFVGLLKEPLTLERIGHMLDSGKALRN